MIVHKLHGRRNYGEIEIDKSLLLLLGIMDDLHTVNRLLTMDDLHTVNRLFTTDDYRKLEKLLTPTIII